MAKQIELTHGRYVIVDDEDYERLSSRSWCVSSYGYAVRGQRIDGKTRMIFLHRDIMGVSGDTHIDHINRNKLDCRKSNLRIATRKQNNRNVGPSKNSKSGFKGVTKVNKRWRATITIDRRIVHLGYFDSPGDAARAYNRAALEFFGEFAYLNEA